MITAEEKNLGRRFALGALTLLLANFLIQVFVLGPDASGYNETWGPALSAINFVLSFAFLFVLYIGTKLFGGENDPYVNVTGTMAFVAHVVITMPSFGAIGQ